MGTENFARRKIGIVIGGAAVAVLMGVFSLASAMTPSLMRAKERIESPSGSYWEVRITCSDFETRRFIIQTEEDGQWCARDVPGLCDDAKIGAAVLVCEPSYREALAAQEGQQRQVTEESAETAREKARLLQERVALQRQRLDLAERKLELSRREMELREREVNLLERRSKEQP